MKFVVETWDPAYGSSVREPGVDPSSQPVEVSVECEPDEWRPIQPGPDTETPGTMTFVDGVRRIDARIWIPEPDGRSRPGVCASVAAGAVRCRPAQADITNVIVARGLYSASDQAASITTDGGLDERYSLRKVSDDSDESLYLGVHRHMTDLEASLAVELGDEELVVFDGPLGHRNGANSVGYIKTHHVEYLPQQQLVLVAGLATGERSPLFRIGGQWPTWSWYLRLPGPVSHGFSGIVRLELPGLGGVVEAAERADAVSSALPRFASEGHKEPRAPQNLYPIAGLERQLRRRLGDARLLERALRRSAA